MSSCVTIKSKWRDTPWVPEPGSPLGPAYSYTLGNETHYLSREEQEAGERMGCQSYLDYACGVPQFMQHTSGGWEYFDQRPGIRGANMTDWEYLTKANRWWAEEDINELLSLRRRHCSWLECSVRLGRTVSACKCKLKKLYLYA